MKIVHSSIDDFRGDNAGGKEHSKFQSILKSTWKEALDKPDVFRYKIDNIKKRFVDKGDRNYLLLLNPDRALNRRVPEMIDDMNQPLDESKFNFTKVSQDEILFSVGSNDKDPELHAFIVNASPISKYHTLFCPFVNQKLHQAITREGLEAAVRVLFVSNDCDLKIGFNSLCALASVNHLHFHLLREKTKLAVERAKRRSLTENLFCLSDYPVPGFCMSIASSAVAYETQQVYKLIKYLKENSIAHNIFLSLSSSCVVDVYIFPRKSTAGVKEFTHFNVAVLEFSGWFSVFNEESYNNMTMEDIEIEMTKWIYQDFEKLCDKAIKLFRRKIQ